MKINFSGFLPAVLGAGFVFMNFPAYAQTVGGAVAAGGLIIVVLAVFIGVLIGAAFGLIIGFAIRRFTGAKGIPVATLLGAVWGGLVTSSAIEPVFKSLL